MFSRNGTRLVFTANRHAGTPREQNVFVCDWRQAPLSLTSRFAGRPS
jgi:hypothetical protein